MSERLEQFGTPCSQPEPETVGSCGACGGDIYDYELAECDCGKTIHDRCILICETCGIEGCRKCLTEIDNYFYCEECKDANN